MNRSSLALAAFALALAAPAGAADAIKIGSKIPFANSGVASDAVRAECKLETNLPEFIVEFAGGAVALSDNPGKGGRVFDAKITNVLAPGGGSWSGPKSVLVEGQLKQNGKVVGTVAARRNTTRGGYGTCGMLNFAARAVAKDIAGWLKEPSMGARLGDAGK